MQRAQRSSQRRRVARTLVLLLLACMSAGITRAQNGFSMSFGFLDVHGERRSSAIILALRYDHHILDHLAYGLDLGFAPMSIARVDGYQGQLGDVMQFCMDYRAYYLIGNGDGTRPFIGSRTGLHIQPRSRDGGVHGTLAMPLGLRVGVRGAMDGFFGDLYVEAGYQLGGAYRTDSGEHASLGGFMLQFGFSYGMGWD